jgi:hypothetical protein
MRKVVLLGALAASTALVAPTYRLRTLRRPRAADGDTEVFEALDDDDDAAAAPAPANDDFTPDEDDPTQQTRVLTCVEIKIYGVFVLNRRVDLRAIDATPARWRGDAGSSPLVHPTHWLISTQVLTYMGLSLLPVWKSNFGCPTPSARCCLHSCICSTAWSFQAIDAMLSP